MSATLDVDAVLFDLDGTLADTAGDLAGALNRVRADHGRPPLPVAALRSYASAGARGLLGAGMGLKPDDASYGAARDAFLKHYANLAEFKMPKLARVEHQVAGAVDHRHFVAVEHREAGPKRIDASVVNSDSSD